MKTEIIVCPICGSSELRKNGKRSTKSGLKQKYDCLKCGKPFSIPFEEVQKAEAKDEKERLKAESEAFERKKREFIFQASGKTGKLEGYLSKRPTSDEELLDLFEIDRKVWRVKSMKIGNYESHTRLRQYNDDGHRISDEHKIVPLFKIEATLEKNTPVIEATVLIEDQVKDAKKFAPKYPKIKYKNYKEGHLFIPDMPDIHFGKETWAEESGIDWGIQKAEHDVIYAVEDAITQASKYPIKQIVVPLGNDFFNVNNKLNTTSHNTPQQEDTRFLKTFRLGRILATTMIDLLVQIAPVEVLIIPGNHDEDRIFYLGDSLECWYRNSRNVKVDNRAVKRKYYHFGRNLIGFTHGYYEKLAELPSIMTIEAPDLWAKSDYREFHTGDKHHKADYKQVLKTYENKGVVTRILRALTPTDTWHHDKGFIGAVRGGEGFVYHPDNGLRAQFTANLPKRETA